MEVFSKRAIGCLIKLQAKAVDEFFSGTVIRAGLPDFFCFQNGKNVTNDHNTFQMAVKIYLYFLFQGPPKCTRIWIFGKQTFHSGNPGFKPVAS
jgi:hypothetical protein